MVLGRESSGIGAADRSDSLEEECDHLIPEQQKQPEKTGQGGTNSHDLVGPAIQCEKRLLHKPPIFLNHSAGKTDTLPCDPNARFSPCQAVQDSLFSYPLA